jgi:hypothetical protein
MLNKVNLRLTDLVSSDENGNTILHQALLDRDWQLIGTILGRIVSTGDKNVLNAQNNDGDTPLHIAVRKYPLNKVSNLMITLGASTRIANKKHEIIKIADNIADFLKKTNYSIDITPPEDMLNVAAITVINNNDSATTDVFPGALTVEENENSRNSRSPEFPTDLTVIETNKKRAEDIIPPVLVTEDDAMKLESPRRKSNLEEMSRDFFRSLVRTA